MTEYHAYVENVSGTTIGSCSTTGALTCTVTGLSPNTDYKVIVSAWNSAGGVNRSSGDQNSPRTPARTSEPTSDTERPVIVAGSGVVEKASVKFGENFTITFRATDNVGIAGIQGIVYRPDSFPVFEGGNGPRISGSSTDGVYRSTLAIPATVNNGGIQNNPIGTYKVYANVQDSASNSSFVGGSYYIYIGTIEVTG